MGGFEQIEYDGPKRNEEVDRNGLCADYCPREGAIPRLKGCWYCRFADFHLKEEKALEIGICCWPRKIIK